jgi:hypothetical protein
MKWDFAATSPEFFFAVAREGLIRKLMQETPALGGRDRAMACPEGIR